MTIEEIRKEWVSEGQNPIKAIEFWNAMAENPGFYEMSSSEFIDALDSMNMLQPDYEVLDLGCGTGVYSFGMADKIGHSTACDISPRMLEIGEDIKKKKGIKNVDLVNLNWHTVDIDEEAMRNKYDLVFIHMSPAVKDAKTFEKMMDASRRYCAVCTHFEVDNPVMAKVRQLAGLDEFGGFGKKNAIYMLDMLFQMGAKPKLFYEKRHRVTKNPIEEAISSFMVRAMKDGEDIPKEKKKEIREYLESIAKDGIVTSVSDSTTITIAWEKPDFKESKKNPC